MDLQVMKTTGFIIISGFLIDIIASMKYRPGFPAYNNNDLYPKSCYNNKKDCRVYTFSFFSVDDILFNFNGTSMGGYYVELVKTVCKLANKRCTVALVEFKRCWLDIGISKVLDNRIYDTCALAFTYRRAIAYGYSQTSLNKGPHMIAIVREDSLLQESNFTEDNNLTLAYPSDTDSVLSGALAAFNSDFYINRTVGVSTGTVSGDVTGLVNEVLSGNADVALVWDSTEVVSNPNIRKIFKVNLTLGGLYLTVRKDELDLLHWWDVHHLKLMCTKNGQLYKKFCDSITEKFGVSNLTCFMEDERKKICNSYWKDSNKSSQG